MTDAETLAFIRRVLCVARKYDDASDITWTIDANDNIGAYVNCNDLFSWACADAEDVTPENVHLLEQSYADCEAAIKGGGYVYGSTLFCCRVRGIRPQGAAYPRDDYKALWSLFDQCGPVREVGLGNPKKHPGEAEGHAVKG